ncbi:MULTISPECIES: YitT family protein [unclassified Pseudodesulfovibrio]|uniref:YitT family protein n=1 Tax=unclassified Pseudodesulfovibrio TaxID=2661612 RepID=UPI000FEBECAB|nr:MULTISPECIES: YitT family protein [unclassified Pseudodesulfovibrio]MCJ2165383.1 YitT family protein [Pseudodesulfovibrio sp. S3-i]RWU02845.1 YitT family protein [Pseudodesulfovibrio sp. S3]
MENNFGTKLRGMTFGVPWNIALLTFGSFLIAFSVKAIAVPQGLLTGGISGIALLCYYAFGGLTTGQWYLLLNLPVFVLGWVFVSKRFFFYSLYGMFATSLFIDLIPWTLHMQDIWLAVITGGGVMGAGVGVVLRSLGSSGGSDILAVICKEKFNMSMGSFEFWFNSLGFLAGFLYLDMHIVLYSIAMTFVIALGIEYVLGMFSERKMVMIISDHHAAINAAILTDLDRGVTILEGTGGYTGDPKKVVLTMIASMQLKELEELVYTIDPEAFFIMGSGFHVQGQGFSSRKVY